MSSQPAALLYKDQSEWQDVTPLPQYSETNTQLAPIFYTAEYTDATDYFRGIVNTGEMSQRVLELTEHVIRLNPAHYSVWQYRFKTLIALQSPLDVELQLMDELAVKHLKTYQVWHHRRLLFSEAGLAKLPRSPNAELDFIARSFVEDAKNYHTWSYRQWLLAYFNRDEMWAGELEFVEGMLASDVRNNSAWHHRFFVVFTSGVRSGDEDRAEVLRRELAFVKDKISLAPNNASSWNYLRGMLDHTATSYATEESFVLPYTSASVDEQLSPGTVIDVENPLPSNDAQLPCAAAIEFLADAYEGQAGSESTQKAVQLWKSLAHTHDTIRRKYWEFRIKNALVSLSV